PEVKQRAEDLLRKRKGARGWPGSAAAQRAVEVLEKIGTPLAKKLLRGLLERKIDAPLEEVIKGSLERLGGGGKNEARRRGQAWDGSRDHSSFSHPIPFDRLEAVAFHGFASA